jgi:fatty acid desaturase
VDPELGSKADDTPGRVARMVAAATAAYAQVSGPGCPALAVLGPSEPTTGTTMTQTATPSRKLRESSDYAELMADVQRAGLMERSLVPYLPRLAALAAMVAAGVFGLLQLGNSWWQLAIAAYFGVVFAQLGFLGHDAGHQQIFRAKKWNDRVGLAVANLGVGLSYGWWVDKHNRHHRNPNEVGRDPDVDRNVLAWTTNQASRQRGLLRVIARHQHVAFFPLLLLEGWNLHVGSVRTLARRSGHRVLESSLLFAHVAGSVALLLTIVSPAKAVVFVVVQQSVLGLYLGSAFAPNHKGMDMPAGGGRSDFLRRQVLTSRDIVGGRLTAAVFGGLNFQIEHHLFPSMPSRNLRRCRPIVREFCRVHGITYTETSLLASYRWVLRYLHSVQPAPIA